MRRPKVTKIDRQLIWLLWGGTCAYCHADLDRDEPQPDHITPLKRGGLHVLANVALSCGRCNIRKKARTAAELGRPDVHQRARQLAEEAGDALLTDAVLRGQPASYWLTGSPLARSSVEPF